MYFLDYRNKAVMCSRYAQVRTAKHHRNSKKLAPKCKTNVWNETWFKMTTILDIMSVILAQYKSRAGAANFFNKATCGSNNQKDQNSSMWSLYNLDIWSNQCGLVFIAMQWRRKEVSRREKPDVHPQLLDMEQQYKNCVWTINTRLPVKLRMRWNVRAAPLKQITDENRTSGKI